MALRIISLCAVIVILLSTILFHQFSKYAFSDVNRYSLDKMHSSIDNIQFVLERMKSFTLRIFVDERIQRYLSLEVHDGGKLWNMYSGITNYLLDEPYIHSVYLINRKTGIVFDSKHGMFDYHAFIDRDREMIEKLEGGHYEPLAYFSHQIGENSYLALIIEASMYKGTMVVLLDVEKLSAYLLQSKSDSAIKVYLTNESGEFLLGGEDWELVKDSLSTHDLEGDGRFEMDYNGQKWSVNVMTLDDSGWKIYHMLDMKSWRENVTRLQSIIIASSLMTLVVIFIIVLWQSRQTYRPFSQLAEEIEKKVEKYINRNKNSGGEAHQVIKEGFDTLVNALARMNDSVRDHKHIVKEEQLRQWILQGNLNKPMKKYLSEETNLFQYPVLYLLVIRIERYPVFLEKYNLPSRKALKYAIGNIAEHLLDQLDCSVEFADFGSDHIVIMVGSDRLEQQDLHRGFDDIRVQVKRWLDLEVTVAVSDPKNMDDNMRYTYNEIYDLSTLKFITGEDKVYYEADSEQYMSIISPMKDNVQDMLTQAVRLGDAEKVRHILNQIFLDLQKMKYEECRFQLTVVIYSVLKSFSQLTHLHNFDGIRNQLGKFTRLSDVMAWLQNELTLIMDNLNERRNSDRKIQLVDEIVEFIEMNIHDPMLTVNQIADHMSLSVSYIRQIFREVKHQTLAEYIMAKRINNAKKLLETTEWLIVEVGERSGFQTKSNFYTAFKKAVGMTPSEYRESRHRSADENRIAD